MAGAPGLRSHASRILEALAAIEARGCRAPSPEPERVERRLMAAVLGVVEMENQRIA